MADTREKLDTVRMPPQSLEAEAALLGSLLLDKEAFWRVADVIESKDFYKAGHRIIFETIQEVVARREAVDILSVQERLREKNELEPIGGVSYLTSLVNTVPTASNAAHYARIVHRKRIHRDLIEAAHRISELGYKEDEDLETVLDDAEKTVFAVAQSSLAQEFQPVKKSLEEAWQRIEKLQAGDGALRGVSTGFPDLDNILAGLQKSDLIVLAARPSLGKTSLALDMAKNVALKDNLPVGFFSIEMSREQVVDRLIASQASVDLWKLRTGRLSDQGDDNDFSRIHDAMETLSKIPLFIDDVASPTVMQIRAMARRLQAEHGDLGLVVIDYLQLIRGHESAENRVQEVSEISRALKAMAKELNVPVLAISQLSRAVEMRSDAVPKLSDLRESGCLAGDTLLMRADNGELVTIKDLVGKKDVPVYSLERGWRVKPQIISKVFSSGRKQIFELKFRSGRAIKASANHKFRTINTWQRLDELAPGMHIASPRTMIPFQPKQALTRDELVLLAHLTGDGCVLPRQPVHYTSADPANIQIVSETAKRLFNIAPRTVRQKNWWHIYLPSPYHLTHNRPHPITAWYRKLGLASVRSYEKKLPSALFQSDAEHIRLFLHHLWATDGNISWKHLPGRISTAAIYYATGSKILAGQVQHLLLRIGIHSVIRKVPQGRYRAQYHVHVQGSPMQLRFLESVGSYGARGTHIPELIASLRAIRPNPNLDIIPKESWQVFVAPAKHAAHQSWRDLAESLGMSYSGSSLFHSGLSRGRMERVAVALASPRLLELAESDVFWDEILTITPLGVEEVFDATVPGTHNFIANDIIVHNSIEQDADVVLFIYREDKVKKNVEKKNVAEILIEKHRNGPTGRVELYFNEEMVSFRSMAKHFEEEQF